MTLGDMIQRYAARAMVATAIISEATMAQVRGPAAGIAVGVAAAAGGQWEVQGRARRCCGCGYGRSCAGDGEHVRRGGE